MNRMKQLLAWILAFVMVWIQMPAVEIFATTYYFSDEEYNGDDYYNLCNVLPGDQLIFEGCSETVFTY